LEIILGQIASACLTNIHITIHILQNTHTHIHKHTYITYIIIIIIILFIVIKYLESNSYALQQSPQARPTKKEVNSTSKTLEREREIYIYILEMGSKVTLTIVWLGGGICAIEGGRRGGGELMRAPD
jgi:3-dehydroquinate synthetase